MADKGWDGHPLGGAAVVAVTGMKIGTALEGTAGVLRIEYGKEPTLTKREAKQFLMNAKQVRELSKKMADLADRLEANQGAPGKVN
ncbi:hypothetical protein [Aliiruegeria lutimaris]|uniref:Uncharacterized protein n=1 Tax=Aliiruegeria lutimaris TaxID=571298 RepID=A0A1G8Y3S4_9RHOB|nr:hypothetical protein [Aliiruegeria lutimaris]SDJ97472.1 hypothetical protein SAMN04488026_102813 [Aliiruegeria lutimaris]